MNYQYKLIVSNHNFYKEFEITGETEHIKLGTNLSCGYRLNPDYFFEDIELDLEKKENWNLSCNDNLYISRGDVRKLFFTELKHGDVLKVCYADSGEEIFELHFLIDFESAVSNYNWKIDLSKVKELVISDKAGSDIVLNSDFGKNTSIKIKATTQGVEVVEQSSPYGVYVNGRLIDKKVILEDSDFVSVADFSFYYTEGKIFFDGNGFEINIEYMIQADYREDTTYPKFVRNTRIKSQIDEEKIKILDPPSIPKKPELNIVTSLVPTIVMFVLVVVLRGIMSTSAGSYVLFSICSMGMGVMTSVFSIVNNQKKYRKECSNRKEKYLNYIEEKEKEIVSARQLELDCLRGVYYSIEQDLEHINHFNSCLFDREVNDDDFLDVYLGMGEKIAKKEIDYKPQEKLEPGDELSQLPSLVSDKYKHIKNAPIVVKLKNANAIGVVGDKKQLYKVLKNFVIDLVSRQYYGDLSLYALLDEDICKYNWMRYIPHIQNQEQYRNIVCDTESKNNIFESLYKELSARDGAKNIQGWNVILVMNENGIKSHPISEYIEKAFKLKTIFIFFEEKEEYLPLYCSKIVKLKENNSGLLFESNNKTKKQEFIYSDIEDREIEKAMKILSPIYCEEISLDGALRKSISLFELLGIYSVKDINLEKRWKDSCIYNSMAVPLGVNVKDDIVYLDLHEKYHGPHGLVAGTTGSGKSEILQTYILGAATLFHPYEVGFVIIDFKGGGMVNQFKNLPHLIGAITNIDGREINRSLKSIKAELLKRQTLFAEANVNHIDKYIKLYKEGTVVTPLPHLIIIVDEFAELKAEQPEFMKELISAARIGRSLGVHLILATQKPSGQVNEQIWSNSKFKLCLKVQSKEDSNEVLKSPLASEIKEPGRAYLQIGNNEVFELLQSGFSGAQEKSDENREKEFMISEVIFDGKRKPIYVQKRQKSNKENRTQLEAIVEYIRDFCKESGTDKLPNICLPPLKESILIEENLSNYDITEIPIGIFDDPDTQYQGEARFNFCESNTLIIGSAATGKTNLLQTIIRQISSEFSPVEANIYILDFGAMYLKNFEHLNHVGGVVTISDEEKLRNLFKLLLEQIQIRKEKFLEMGISSFNAYREAGYNEFPQIFLLIDNFAAFKEIYADAYEENFIYVTREGLACGISVTVTNSQTAGFGYKYMSNFACRIAFHCNDSSEYSSLFDRCRLKPKEVPGRALCKMDKDLYEMQTFLAFEGEKEIERSNKVKEYVKCINKRYLDERAKRIPEIPNILNYQYILDNYDYKKISYKYPIGLDYSTVDVVSLDFKDVNEFCIVGNDKEKRVLALEAILCSVEKNILSESVKMFIIDDVQRTLKSKSDKIYVDKYTIDYSIVGELINETEKEFERRYEILLKNGVEAVEKLPLYMFIINNRDAIEYISTSKEILEIYNKLVKQYRALGVCFIYSDMEDVPVSRTNPLMKGFKEAKKAMITTSDLKEVKFFDISSSVARTMKKLQQGDSYFLDGSKIKRIKTVEVRTNGR